MSRGQGVFALASADYPNERCVQFLLSATTDGALDIIELSFRMMERIIPRFGSGDREDAKISITTTEAIDPLPTFSFSLGDRRKSTLYRIHW